jgi:type VI secretion system protein ImpC
MHPPLPNSSSPGRISITLAGAPGAPARELPFVIGVFASLSGMPEKPLGRVRDRRFVSVESSNFDAVMEAFAPRLVISITNKLSGDEDASQIKVHLAFRGMEDFRPESIVRQMPVLGELMKLRGRLASLLTSVQAVDGLDEMLHDAVTHSDKLDRLREEIAPKPDTPPQRPSQQPVQATRPALQTRPPTPSPGGVWSRAKAAEESPSLLDQLVEASDATTPYQREETRDSLTQFISEVLDGNMTTGFDVETMIHARIYQIDQLISLQVREVLGHADFMSLESSWRGLYFLVVRTHKAANVKIQVLNITKKELAAQFFRQRAREDSAVARKVLDQKARTVGETPIGLLIGDFSISKDPEDTHLMEMMARLGSAAQVPFIAAADPKLLGFSSFTQIVDATLPDRTFDAVEYTSWSRLRSRPESRYIGLVLPRVLLRLPYSSVDNPEIPFRFEEDVDGTDRSRLLWGSAAWAFAARQAADFDRYGWFGAQRAPDDSGELTDLPAFNFLTEDRDLSCLGPAEIVLSDARYLELRSLGLIPLCQIGETGKAKFFEAWSCHKPKIDPDYDPPTTYESAEIDCVLSVSRIAHYLRDILQTERERFQSLHECEDHLRRWIAPYVAPDYARETSFESAFPLLSAGLRIELATEGRHSSSLRVWLTPRRAVGSLPHPVEVVIQVALPLALGHTSKEPVAEAVQSTELSVLSPTHGAFLNGFPSRRDQFIHRVMMAESCIVNRRLDVAIAILEDLAEQIDRYHLDEWESTQLVTHVWDLLRRCYLLIAGASGVDDRSAALLRKICHLDPTRALN